MLRVGCFVAVLGLVAGCGQSAPTQLIVVVDTDYVIPSGLDTITIDVTGPDGMRHHEQQMITSAAQLPLTLTLVPAGSALGPVRVEAQGLHGGTWRVTRTAQVTLVAQQTLTLPLFLLHACEGQTCGGDASRTCGDNGSCQAVETPLLPWSGQPIRIGQDASVPIDAGMDGSPLPHDAGPHDAGPPLDTSIDAPFIAPDTGVVDCRMFGCDDHEPCTDDVCGTDGNCTHTNNTVACDDHMFCNGMDTCGGGTCSAHTGNPCVAGTCDEAGGRCVGCGSDADCPAPTMGAFGACSFADSCTTTGSQTRTRRTFHCASNACTPTDTTDTQSCSRTTEGSVCGTTSCTSFGSCGGFADTCATSGTASRTCTDLTCHGGACTPAMRADTQSCSRSTDGTACSATSCSGFGACTGFSGVCGNSGTQSQTCTDYTCGGGSCTGATRTDTQACSRSTDGTSCGTTSCGAWSTCTYDPMTCSTVATQSRTCTDAVCSGGSCSAPTRTETQPCPPAPAGTDCIDNTIQCGVWQCDGAGSCRQTSGFCTGGTICCDNFTPARCTTSRVCLL